MLKNMKNMLHKQKQFFQKTVSSLFQPNSHYQILQYLRCFLKVKLNMNNFLVGGERRWYI